MPSTLHEILVDLFRQRPELTPRLLRDAFRMRLPPHELVRVGGSQQPRVEPAEYRADLVVELVDGRGSPVLGVVVEVQLTRDPDKRWSWPWYLASLHSRLRCPTALLVVAPYEAIARWASRPIETFQPGSPFVPLVLGPNGIPRVVDPDEARASPELSVLSVLAHSHESGAGELAYAATIAVDGLDTRIANLYHEVIWQSLGAAARRALEELMSHRYPDYEYQNPWIRKGIEQGRKEGREEGAARALLAILDARNLAVSEAERARILECADLAVLDYWLRQAAIAASTEEALSTPDGCERD